MPLASILDVRQGDSASPKTPAGQCIPETLDTRLDSSTAPRDLQRVLPMDLGRAFQASPPVRMHIEWSASTASVWIGVDQAASVDVSTLVAALSKSLAATGLQLRSVVCNGVQRYARRVDEGTLDIVIESET